MESKDTIMSATRENGEQIKEYRKKDEELRAAIEDIERIRSESKFPHWKDNCLVVIAEAIAKELGTDYELLGPFGLGAEVGMHFGTDVGGDRVCKYSLTIVPIDTERGKFAYKDYSQNSHQFAEGTIGAANGFNYAEIEITEDMTIADLVAIIKAKEEEE